MADGTPHCIDVPLTAKEGFQRCCRPMGTIGWYECASVLLPVFCSAKGGCGDRDTQWRRDHTAALPSGLRQVSGRPVPLRALHAGVFRLNIRLAALPTMSTRCQFQPSAHWLR